MAKRVFSDAYVQWEAKGFPISTDMLYLTLAELNSVISNKKFGHGVCRFARYILDDEVTYSELVKTLYQYNLINQHQLKLIKEGKIVETKVLDEGIKDKVQRLIAEEKGFKLVPKDIRRTNLSISKPSADDLNYADDFDDDGD